MFKIEAKTSRLNGSFLLVVFFILGFNSVALGVPVFSDPRFKSVQLTKDKVNRLWKTLKVIKARRSDPLFRREICTEFKGNQTLEEVATMMKLKRPLHVKVFENQGLSVEEHNLLALTVGMADALYHKEPGSEIFQEFCDPANIVFVGENLKRVRQIRKMIYEISEMSERCSSSLND